MENLVKGAAHALGRRGSTAPTSEVNAHSGSTQSRRPARVVEGVPSGSQENEKRRAAPLLQIVADGGVEPDIDIIAIHDYRESSKEAWTFNIQRFREGLTKQKYSPPKFPESPEGVNSTTPTKAGEPSPPPRQVPNFIQDPGLTLLRRVNASRSSHSQPPAATLNGVGIQDRNRSSRAAKLGTEASYTRDPTRGVNWVVDGDMLRDSIPSARIITMDYPETPASSKTPPSLKALARTINDELQELRRDCQRRPLMVFTHNLGFSILVYLLTSTPPNTDFTESLVAVAMFCNLDTSLSDKSDRTSDPLKCVLASAKGLPFVEIKNEELWNQHKRDIQSLIRHVPEHTPATHYVLVDDAGNTRDMRSLMNQVTKPVTFGNDGRQFKDYEDEAFQNFLRRLFLHTFTFALIHAVLGSKDCRALLKDINCSLQTAGDNLAVNLRDGAGRTALHFAIQHKRKEQLRQLLGMNGIHVDPIDASGRTPLYYAVSSPSPEPALMATLMDKNANYNIADKHGVTPLSLAEEKNVRRDMFRVWEKSKQSAEPEEHSIKQPEPVHNSVMESIVRDSLIQFVEFSRSENEHCFSSIKASVYETLYETTPEKIFEDARGNGGFVAQSKVQWLHVPHNHTKWIEGLFARLNISTEPMEVDQHLGTTVWSRFMRPQSREFTAFEVKDENLPVKRKGILLYIPFLNFERHCDQLELYNSTIHEGEKVSASPYVFELFMNGLLSPDSELEQSESPDAGTKSPELSKSTSNLVPNAKGLTSEPKRKHAALIEPAARSEQLLNEHKLLRACAADPDDPLHVRRTLDQSYYFMLDDTRARDRNQVVLRLRELKKDEHGHTKTNLNTPRNQSPVVMVDQLWLWILGDTVITSFPRNWLQPDWTYRCDILSRLEDHIRVEKNRAAIKTSMDLARVIIKHCLNVCNHTHSNKQLQQLHLNVHGDFEESVGICADMNIKLFQKFQDQLAMLGRINQAQVSTISARRIGQHEGTKLPDETHPEQNRSDREVSSIEEKLLEESFDLEEEVSLLEYVKDLCDELRMINSILEDQKRAMHQFNRTSLRLGLKPDADSVKSGTSEGKSATSDGNPGPDGIFPMINGNLRHFERMFEHAKGTERELNHLLDLRQKYTNALEARFARRSAVAASEQSRIVMFFTIVTIIFGSLSFSATFFALKVDKFPDKDGEGDAHWKLPVIVGIIIAVSLAISSPFILFAFSMGYIKSLLLSSSEHRHRLRLPKPNALSTDSTPRATIWKSRLETLYLRLKYRFHFLLGKKTRPQPEEATMADNSSTYAVSSNSTL